MPEPAFPEWKTQELLQQEQEGRLSIPVARELSRLRQAGRFPLAEQRGYGPAPAVTPTPSTPPIAAPAGATNRPGFLETIAGVSFPGDIALRIPRGTSPEQEKKLQQDYSRGVRESVAPALEYGLPLAVSILLRNPSPSSGTFMYILKNFGRSTLLAAIQYLASKGAQQIAPERETHPASMATGTGIGEYLGGFLGRFGSSAGGVLGRHFTESPQGTIVRETLESRGAPYRADITTRSPFLQGMGKGLEHLPGGQRLRTVREQGKRVVSDAIDSILGRASTTGTETDLLRSRAGAGARTMSNVPGTPGQTAQELARDLTENIPVGNAQTLKDVADQVRTRVQNQAIDADQAVHQAFRNVDAQLAQLPIDTAPLTRRGIHTSIPKTAEPQSIYHEMQTVLDTLRNLPKTISFDGIQDLQRSVESTIGNALSHIADLEAAGNFRAADTLRQRWLPELNWARQTIKPMVESRFVDMTGAKAAAQRVMKHYEAGLQMSKDVMEGGSGRAAYPTEDPHVMAAQKIIEGPDRVDFFTAQQRMSNVGTIKREHAEPAIFNSIREAAEDMRNAIDVAMRNTAKTVDGVPPGGKPGPFETRFMSAREEGAKAAQLHNSDLLTQLRSASLDDVITGLVQNRRTNDLETLRGVIGEQLWPGVQDMWLRQVVERSRDPNTRIIRPGQVLRELQDLTPETSLSLFGRQPTAQERLQGINTMQPGPRLNGLRQALEQADALHRLPGARDTLEIQSLFGKLTPIQQEAVQREWIEKLGKLDNPRDIQMYMSQLSPTQQHEAQAQWIKAGIRENKTTGAPIDYDYLHNHLAYSLGDEAKDALFSGNKQQLTQVQKALSQASSMEKAISELKNPVPNATLLSEYRQAVNDPTLWQSVTADWLREHLHVDSNSKLLKGRPILDAIEQLERRSPSASLELFPDRGALQELRRLAETLMVLEGSASEHHFPYRIQHIQPLLRVAETGGLIYLGFTLGHPEYLVPVALGIPGISWLLTNSKTAKMITQGFQTPWNSERAGRLIGQITGELLGAQAGEESK